MPEPIDVETVKKRLGIRNDQRDEEIAALIRAARGQIEDYSGHLLTRRSHKKFGTTFSGIAPVALNVWPVHDLVKVEHLGSDGTAVEIVDCRLVVMGEPARVFPPDGEAWPVSGLGYSIEVDAGWDEGDAPDQLLQAMLLLIGHWFENHEATVVGTSAVELPLGVKDLCQQFRLPGFV